MNSKKKGHWIKRHKNGVFWHFRCSECMTTVAHSTNEFPILKYCPNCYKEMEIDREENDVNM